jgi:TM2 domain-containing membrane protein YozV
MWRADTIWTLNFSILNYSNSYIHLNRKLNKVAKSKGTAYLLSFLIAGVGQMYLGNFTRGVVILISALVIGFVSFSVLNIFGFVPTLIFFIWQIWDAGKEYEKRRFVPIDGNITCPNCDSANVTSSEYCTKCGYKIQQVCENCNTPNVLDVSFCGKCGRKF